VLTGVDLGAFGRERGQTLAPFARRLLEAIAPARLRLSSINANDFTPELVELAGALPVVKSSVSIPPDPDDWERLTSEVTVAITGFGG